MNIIMMELPEKKKSNKKIIIKSDKNYMKNGEGKDIFYTIFLEVEKQKGRNETIRKDYTKKSNIIEQYFNKTLSSKKDKQQKLDEKLLPTDKKNGAVTVTGKELKKLVTGPTGLAEDLNLIFDKNIGTLVAQEHN